MMRLVGLGAVLAAAFAFFYAAAVTPPVAGMNAPAGSISGARAMADIRVMGAAPHPVGSAAHDHVRDYLIGRMAALGLSPQVQRDDSFDFQAVGAEPYVSGAMVDNIVGVLPGRSSARPALALMAHYDSVEGSPGAADDAAGVAAILEMVRAIKARGVPARDVIVIITDGEEPGLLGSRAFFADHPLARRVGFVINLDVRGGGGRTRMFQTSPQAGQVIDLYRRTAISPEANSLAAFIAAHMANDTDFTVAVGKGVPGLNYAFVGRQFDYHAPSSTVAVVDQGAVQHLAEEPFGTVLALAFSDRLPGRAPDVIYGNVVGPWMVAYPFWGGWAALAIAAVLGAVGAGRALHAGALSRRNLWVGMGTGLLLLVGGAMLLRIVRLATGVPFGFLEGRPLLARFPLFEGAMAASGLGLALLLPAALSRGKARGLGAALFVALGVALAALEGFAPLAVMTASVCALLCALVAWIVLRKPRNLPGVWTGLLMTGLALGIALQIALPAGTPVIAWPLIGAALTSALCGAGTARPALWWAPALVVIVGVLTFCLQILHGLMQAADMPEPLALTFWLAAMAFLPLAWPDPEDRYAYAPGLVSLCGGIAGALVLAFTSPWTARYPDAVEPLFIADVNTGRAWRASLTPPGGWTRSLLQTDGGAVGRYVFPGIGVPLWAAPAAPLPGALTPPAITVSRSPAGTVTLHAPMAAGDRRLQVDVRCDTLVSAVTLNGKPVALLQTPGRWSRLRWQAAPGGFTVTFTPLGPGALDIRYAVFREGWPAGAKPLPPLPPTAMLWDLGGSSVVSGAMRRTWP